MVTVDDFFQHDGMLINKSQLMGVLPVKQLAKTSWGFHIIFWGKERLVYSCNNKDQCEMMRTKWITENLEQKKSP